MVGPAIMVHHRRHPSTAFRAGSGRRESFHPASLAANTSTSAPRMIRYTANGAKPCLRTQAMNHATEAYATRKETTNTIDKMSHCMVVITDNPNEWSPFPIDDV